MSNKSKIISIICFFLSTLLLLTACTSSNNDETSKNDETGTGTKSDKIEDGKLNIVINNAEAKPGDEVELKIELVNNTGISSLKAVLSLDPKLTAVYETNSEGDDVAKTDFVIADENDTSVMKSSTYDRSQNVITLNWLTALDEVKGDTVYATVRLKVADDAAEGDVLSVAAEINPNDVFDYDQKNIDFNLINGNITVIAK